MAGLGGEHPGAFLDIENFNLYAPGGISRSGMVNAATDGLFYANMLDVQEILPWAAESSCITTTSQSRGEASSGCRVERWHALHRQGLHLHNQHTHGQPLDGLQWRPQHLHRQR